jgi:signal peptidase I
MNGNGISFRLKVVIALGIIFILLAAGLVALRLAGLVRPFYVPAEGMSPTISAGDHILMEAITYLNRIPGNGDVVVFTTDGITDGWLPKDQYYIKRIAGSPRDSLQVIDGKLFVNGRHVALTNGNGDTVVYGAIPGARYLSSSNDTVTVPDHCYFVIGDNATNSLDSRWWGFLRARSIKGRVVFCYWPPGKIGMVQ